MKIEPKTLKGFRDFLPKEAKKRQYTINILRSVFESYGFEPLETPALEYEEILAGKYGEEGDQLMYRFVDRGDRRVAMRYDQTVPLARVIAQYSPRGGAGQNELAMPFKRYQIQPVWRAENPQKGRFREFMQCDIDTVGSSSLIADAEIIACALTIGKKLRIKEKKPEFKVCMRINDRSIFDGLDNKFITAIDKLKKIGENGVIEELKKLGDENPSGTMNRIMQAQKTKTLDELFSYLSSFGFKEGPEEDFWFDKTLARGLDYYTSTIFELELLKELDKKDIVLPNNEKYDTAYLSLSIGGGGRYDNLIGMFSGRNIPAVGFSFGFDRLIDAMEESNLFPADLNSTIKVLVTIFFPELKEKSVDICSRFRSNNIPAEIYLDENAPLEKQLKYANQKNIPYVIIIGLEEVEKNMVTIRNMNTREQKMVPLEEAIEILK